MEWDTWAGRSSKGGREREDVWQPPQDERGAYRSVVILMLLPLVTEEEGEEEKDNPHLVVHPNYVVES